MMNAFFFLVLYALLQNVDNLVLAAAYRLKNMTIRWRPNLLIAGLSGIATGLGVALAQAFKAHAGHFGLDSATEIVGRGILIMIGSWMLVCYFRAKLFSHPHAQEKDNSAASRGGSASAADTCMSMAEAMICGTALAMDNLAPSFAFGLVNAAQRSAVEEGIILAVLTAAFSVVSVYVGQAVGSRGRNRLRWIAPEVASGCLIISLGLFDPGDVQHLLLR